MKKLLLLLFGYKSVTNIPRNSPKFKTTVLNNRPSLQDWMKEFNVSMLYDRKIVYID
jgi:hypothetical protein